jgi:hypothetical protein
MVMNEKKNTAIRNYFERINGEIIIYPNTNREYNITQNFEECEYCQKDIGKCKGNKAGTYCNEFKIVENFIYRK